MYWEKLLEKENDTKEDEMDGRKKRVMPGGNWKLNRERENERK